MSDQDDLRRRPTWTLIVRLANDLARLARGEIALAQHELGAKVRELTVAAIFGGAALTFALLGALGAFVTALAVLALVLPLWAAGLIVTLGALGLAALLALLAKSRVDAATPLIPEATLATLREDVAFAKARIAGDPE